MKWEKRDGSKSVEDVVCRNTGLSTHEFMDTSHIFTIKGLREAAEKIQAAVSSGICITIYGDYDCDGITASSILYLMLLAVGAKEENVNVILPKRFSEGYGLSMAGVDRIDSGLLITVDNGIAAIDEIAAAKAKGLQTIIIDHHLCRDDGKIPDADIIVDPNAVPGSDFSGYCGAGLAYKLSLLMVDDKDMSARLLSLAAIGTVADVMPLVSDNRNIVIEGLKNINEGKAPVGFNTLIEYLNLSHIDEGDIGFKIGPIINAAGRLYDEGALAGFRLFTGTREYAKKVAPKLIEINEKRKALVTEGVALCDSIIAEDCLFGDAPLIIYTTADMPEQFHEGIVGILAGRMAETYKVPAIILTETEQGDLKGSGRSNGIHLKNLLDSVADTMLGYGGHAGAAGLSIAKDRIEEFKEAIQAEYAKLPPLPQSDPDTVYYDLEIEANDIASVITELERFAPFGEGNPKIDFKISGVKLAPRDGRFYRTMGANGQHLKLLCQNFDAICFDMVERYQDDGEPKSVMLLGNITENYFRGNVTPQVEVLDYQKDAIAKPTSSLAELLAQKLKENDM